MARFPRVSQCSRAVAAGLLVIGMAMCASQSETAQEASGNNGPPPRIANIWDYRAHQPTHGEVSSAEKAAGVAPSVQQDDHIDDQLLTLSRRLLGPEDNLVVPPPKP